MPSFKLNVFIQAKRPEYGRYAPKLLRSKGLRSPYWRFEVTPHQQIALETLSDQLKAKALICYACPAFHKESLLHKWTVTPRIVESSTFPDVSQLKGHIAWNFSQPGATGVPNAEPEASDGPTFFERLNAMVERYPDSSDSYGEDLRLLAATVSGAMEPGDVPASSVQAQFADSVLEISQLISSAGDQDTNATAISFWTVMLFAHYNRLMWLVAGPGDV